MPRRKNVWSRNRPPQPPKPAAAEVSPTVDPDEIEPADRGPTERAEAPAADDKSDPSANADSAASATETVRPAATDSVPQPAPAPPAADAEGEETVILGKPSPQTPPAFYLSYTATSHVGRVRKNNQDSGYASPDLLVVADGMGGQAEGDLASAVAVEIMSRLPRTATGEAMLDAMEAAMREANQAIASLVMEDPVKDGMGTTVSGALFDGTELGVGHIGDSRIYRWREEKLEQITHDHSWVQQLIDDGRITPEEANTHPHRSLILRVLNGQPVNEPDLTLLRVRDKDRYLICSDGLCGFVEDEVIASRMGMTDLNEVRDALLNDSLEAGGLDNVTIIVAEVNRGSAAEPQPELILGAATEVRIPDRSGKPPSADPRDDLADDADEDFEEEPSESPTDDDEADEDRYNPVLPPKRRWLRRVLSLVAILALLAAAAGAVFAWASAQYFIGVSGGDVVIRQGVPDVVPGLSTSVVVQVADFTVADLPSVSRNQVKGGITVPGGRPAAEQRLAVLRAEAIRCRASRQPVATPTPSGPARTPPIPPLGSCD